MGFRICKDILRDMSGSCGRISTMCENKSHMNFFKTNMKNHGDNVNHVLNIILSYCCSVQTL
jgi:hypothetical protein